MKIFISTSMAIISFTSFFASAMELGNVSLGGTGCFGSTKLVAISGQAGRYAFPIRARVNKKEEVAFDRKTCNLRIPITLAPNEKVQLVDLSQVVRTVAYKGIELKTNLTVGFVGRNSQPLVYEFKATEDDTSAVEILRANGVVAESDCGKSSMLTGNLSLIASGNNAAAFISTGAALLTLKVVNCNQ